MIRLIVFSLFLCGVCCDDGPFRLRDVPLEKNKPLSLPENAGTNVLLENLIGIIYSDSLSQLNVTNLELRLQYMDNIEPGALCSTPSLKSLKLDLGGKPISVTKEILNNCEKLETLFIGGFPYRHHKINSDAFTNLPNLKALDIYHIDVHHVTKEYFRDLPSLEHLTLKDCLVEEIDTDTFNDLKNLKDLRIITRGYSTHNFNILSKNSIKLENLTFGGLVGTLYKSKLDVKEFHLEAAQLNTIEPGALCPTLSTKRLEFLFESPNSITLTKDTFQNCENLEELLIRGNYRNLSKVEVDTFQNLPNLKKLSLENLKLNHITKDTFKSSLLLENLLLWEDNIQEVDGDAFSHFQHLKQLEIWPARRENSSSEFFFKNTIKVDTLVFKSLTGKLYTPQLKVKEFYLQFDELKEIEPGAICSSPSLKIFYLKFRTDIDFTFTNDTLKCENLEELSLIGSPLNPNQVQEEAFDYLSNLKILYLENLNFSHVKRRYFKKLPLLEKLVLDHCSVKKIAKDAFDDLENLKILQISFNRKLTHIPVNLFTRNTKLEELLLFRNEISGLTWDEFKGLPALTTLSVSGNPIRSFNAEKIAQNIPSLKKIDIVYTLAEGNGFVEELKKKLNVTLGY